MCEAFIKTMRLFEDILQRNEGFNMKSETFSEITRLFEDIFNRIEAY
jgi:hypothetical protein